MLIKQLTLTILILALGLSVHGQTDKFDIKETQKTLTKINETLYASKYEVSNKQYLSFLNFLQQNDMADKYLIAQIDTAKWKDRSTYNESYVKYYHCHPAYMDYPVVNIRYEGATLFCAWLTDQYNSNSKRKFKKIMFRLPTEQEWIIAAQSGDTSAIYPWGGTDLKNKDGLFRCNFTSNKIGSDMGVASDLNNNTYITAPVKSYWPNDFELYNMSGNVAEMLLDKGHTKGGSWRDSAEYMKIDNEGKYAGFDIGQPTIGFRYFMDIIENF